MIDKTMQIQDISFKNRDEAFSKLYDEFLNRHLEESEANASEKDFSTSVILATSLDGLFLADKLAKKLNAKLDVLFCAPISAPLNSEYDIATVSENMDIIMNEPLIDSFGISLDFVYGEAQRLYEEVILPRIYKFRKGASLSDVKQKTIFLIDQGVETGITMSLAIKTCIQKQAKSIYVLTPVIAKEIAMILKERSDAIICVNEIAHFVSTRHYYQELPSISEEQILAIMNAYISPKISS